MLKRKKRFHIDINNHLCIELREYFYAFFLLRQKYNAQSYYDIIKVMAVKSSKVYRIFLISLYKST